MATVRRSMPASRDRLPCRLYLVDHGEERSDGRFDDVGRDGSRPIGPFPVLDRDHGLALRIFATRDAADLEFAQRHVDAGRALDRLEGGIHRPVASRRNLDLPPVGVHEHDAGAAGRGRIALDVQPDELPGPVARLAADPQHQRLDVAVEQLLLLVRKRLEVLEDPVELGIGELEAELAHALAEGVAAAVLAEHEIAAREAHVLRSHDLVGRMMPEHAVLVDPRFVREGVFTDHGLVARDRHSRDGGEQPARGIEPPGVDPGAKPEERLAGLERHHQLLEGAVAGALTDPVDGAFHLPGARAHGGQAVGHGEPEVVVAMRAEHDPVDPAHVLLQVLEGLVVFLRHRIANRVRDVDRRGAGVDRAFDDFGQELELGSRGVLGRKLDVLAQRPRVLHALGCGMDDLLARHVELVLAVDGARGEEEMQPRTRGVAYRRPGPVDVLGIAPGETGDHRALDLPGDGLDRLPVAARGHREAGLDDVDAEIGKRAGDPQLFRLRHRAAGRLLAVAQGRVEYQYAIRIVLRHDALPFR